mgnify:CR=1 FL=1
MRIIPGKMKIGEKYIEYYEIRRVTEINGVDTTLYCRVSKLPFEGSEYWEIRKRAFISLLKRTFVNMWKFRVVSRYDYNFEAVYTNNDGFKTADKDVINDLINMVKEYDYRVRFNAKTGVFEIYSSYKTIHLKPESFRFL